MDGSTVRTIGKRGGEPGEFNFPTNLFVDTQGRLYVADTLNFRIQIFDPDGKLLSAFGTLGDTPGSLNRPKGVGVDSEGHIYVADTSFNNFQIFDQNGQLLLFVGAVGQRARRVLPAGRVCSSTPGSHLRRRPGKRPRAGVPVPAGAGEMTDARIDRRPPSIVSRDECCAAACGNCAYGPTHTRHGRRGS